MPEYKCIKCNYHSNNKSNYTKHLNSNKHQKCVSNRTNDKSKIQEYEIERLYRELEDKDKRIMELENIIATMESSHTYNITIENLVQICNPDDGNAISNLIDLVDDAITYQKTVSLNQ